MGRKDANDIYQKFEITLPYPMVCVERPNCDYARAMLDNVGGCDSEMTAVSLYFYNHLVTQGCPEVAQLFEKISIVEMHHLEIFGKLAMLLGEDPRLWTQKADKKVYWTPAYNCYPVKLEELLENAIRGEEAAIHKYQQQLCCIRDCHIQENLKRIIMDEQSHIEIFCYLYDKYVY